MSYQQIGVASSPDSARHLEYVLKGQEINFLPSIPGKPDLVGWIHDGIDVVWFDLQMGKDVFPPYEDRITLNQESARLTIKDATYEDSGNYDLKLMINGQHHRLKTRIEVIDKVDQPHISCVLTSPNRVLLVCSTDSKHPDLLEFKWSANGKEHPGPNLQINVRGKHDDRVYRCDVSNPLTKETATFTAGDCFLDKPSDGPNDIRKSKTTALLIGVIIILSIITVIVITVGALRRKRKARFDNIKRSVLRRPSSSFEGLLDSDENIKRPNALWDLDLCDALKAYGIIIHGCIDVVTQAVFWLKADNASNAPEVIANHVLDTVKVIEGCPPKLLADPLPENIYIREVKRFLRGKQNYIDKCNTTNERMDSWLLILCEQSIENWTKVFQNLQENGHFTGSDTDKELIQFCFLKPIQDNLNGLLRDWNSQRMLEAAKNKLLNVPRKVANLCKEKYHFKAQNPNNEPSYERCRLIMAENGWNEPENEGAAAKLYKKMKIGVDANRNI
ncbi:kelch-like protein 6 isoform 3-T3 [Syngnathus typhle]